MSTLVQRSFSGGELAPTLYARVDQVKYQTGLRTCRNFLIMRHGGTANRPGTEIVGEVKDSSKPVHFVRFVFNALQTYVLEFGDLYIRFVQNGKQVTETPTAITGATQASPCAIADVAHGYATGDEVFLSGIGGMAQLNGRNFKVVVTGANAYTLKYMDGTNVDSTAFAAYTGGGAAARIYTIVTPYAYADLATIEYAQSGDIITLTHDNYPPSELARLSSTNWTLTPITFEPSIAPPDGGTASNPTGAPLFRYRITAVSSKTKEESRPGKEATKPIAGISQANPAYVQVANHGYTTGDEVFITGVAGMVEINGAISKITVVNVNDFTLDTVDSTGFSPMIAPSGTVARTSICTGNTPSVGAPVVLTLPAVAGALVYNVYRALNGVYGFIGLSDGGTFKDTGFNVDTSDQPPVFNNLFAAAGDYPSTVSYLQQRLTFANTKNNPEKAWASKSGAFKNFSTSTPLKDDDEISFNLAGRQVNAVRHLLELGVPIVFTDAGEWSLQGDSSGTLTPASINPKQHSYSGASRLTPLVIGSNAVFVQARGSIVRDLAFDWQVDGYRGNDLTIFSAHLFDNFSLVDWAYQQIPHSIVWAVRSDGILLGLTYIREQQLWGWHRHDFDGFVENVVSVPEGTEDAVYLVIRRTVNGATKRYIERLATRQVVDIVDSIFVDCSLSYDGRNAGATTMTLTGGVNWDYTELLTLTASAGTFAAGDVAAGAAIHFPLPDGTTLRCPIISYTSPTIVIVRANKTVPVASRGAATTTWSKALKTLGGLWHIEGKALSIAADGFVVANPNNDSYVPRVVAGGQVTLDKAFVVIHAGLPYTSDLETLDMDVVQGETIADKKKLVGRLTIFVEKSRGVWAGGVAPVNDTIPSDGSLQELKIRGEEDESYDDPVALQTGVVDLNLRTEWNSNGRIFIRQTDPMPLSVLAVAPAGYIPIRGGA